MRIDPFLQFMITFGIDRKGYPKMTGVFHWKFACWKTYKKRSRSEITSKRKLQVDLLWDFWEKMYW